MSASNPTNNWSSSVTELLEMMANDPLRAADEFEKTANEMLALAQKLREIVYLSQSQDNELCPGGLSDRVRIKVVGSNGDLKQDVEVN